MTHGGMVMTQADQWMTCGLGRQVVQSVVVGKGMSSAHAQQQPTKEPSTNL